MFTTPTVVGDAVFVGSCSGVIYAFARDTGRVLWQYDTTQDAGPAQFHGDPAVVADVVFTGSDGAQPSLFYAFRAASGELLWKSDRNVIESDVVAAAGLLVGRTSSGDLVALDALTGRRRWRVRSEEARCGRMLSAPAIRADLVISPGSDGTVLGVGLHDGAVRWRREVGCASTAVTLWRGAAYMGVRDDGGAVLRLDPGRGEVSSQVAPGGVTHGHLVVAGDRLVAMLGERTVIGLDPDLAEVVWRHQAQEDLSSPRAHAMGDVVVVGDEDGALLALSPVDGSVVWTGGLSGTVRGLGSSGGVLYVGTLGGLVYAYVPPVREPDR